MTNDSRDHLYKVETLYRGSHFVVASGFDDAVRKLYDHQIANGIWPESYTDETMTERCFEHVSKVIYLGEVVL